MWRALKRLMTWLMLLLLAWYVFDAGLIQHYLVPKINDIFQSEASEEAPVQHSFIIQNPFTVPDQVDEELIRETIFRLTNELREQQGVAPLSQNDALTAVAELRALETETSFSHTRPDNTPFHTALEGIYSYQMAGENLAMGTYHSSDEEMAAFLFEGWVESPGHYENMIEPDFREIGIGVHFDGEMLYLVQTFGTPY